MWEQLRLWGGTPPGKIHADTMRRSSPGLCKTVGWRPNWWQKGVIWGLLVIPGPAIVKYKGREHSGKCREALLSTLGCTKFCKIQGSRAAPAGTKQPQQPQQAASKQLPAGPSGHRPPSTLGPPAGSKLPTAGPQQLTAGPQQAWARQEVPSIVKYNSRAC